MRKKATLVLALGLLLAPGLMALGAALDRLETLLDLAVGEGGAGYALDLSRPPTEVTDVTGDFYHPTGEPPGHTDDHFDITATWAVRLDPGESGLFGPTDDGTTWAPRGPVTPPALDGIVTFTGEQVADGGQYLSGAFVFGFELAGTPPTEVPGRCEYIVWVHDGSAGPTFVNSLPADPAGGTNRAFGLVLNPTGQGASMTFALELGSGDEGFVSTPDTDVRAFLMTGFVGVVVPAEAFGDLAGVNFYSFCAREGLGFEPADTGADQTGLILTGPAEIGLARIQAVAPSTTSTTIALTTSTGAPVTSGSVVEEPAGSVSWWLVAAAIAGLGLLMWRLLAAREVEPCRGLREIVDQAERALEDATKSSSETATARELARRQVAQVAERRRDLCRSWPPVCWSEEEAEGDRDEKIRLMVLRKLRDQYRAGELSAEEAGIRVREVDSEHFAGAMAKRDRAAAKLMVEIEESLETARDDLAGAEAAVIAAGSRVDRARAALNRAQRELEECVEAQTRT